MLTLRQVVRGLKNGNRRGFDKSPLAKILKQVNIPYYTVDIPEYAMGYLMAEIIEKEDQVNGLIEEFLSISDKESIKGVNLKSWIDYLKEEIEEKKLFLDIKLRPEWIVKKILDIIRTMDNNEIIFIHFAQNNVFSETLKLLKDLDIKVKIYEKEMEIFPLNLILNEEELEQWKRKCPIENFKTRLIRGEIIDQSMIIKIQEEILEKIDVSFTFARTSKRPDPSTVLDDVYKNPLKSGGN